MNGAAHGLSNPGLASSKTGFALSFADSYGLLSKDVGAQAYCTQRLVDWLQPTQTSGKQDGGVVLSAESCGWRLRVSCYAPFAM
jgi:hypothetical protein